MVDAIDRLPLLRTNEARFTGIDFVHVKDPSDQTVLHVYFHTDLSALTPPFSFNPADAEALLPQHFVIRNVTDPVAPNVEVVEILPPEGGSAPGFDQDALGRTFLALRVAAPGDFADYRLYIDDPREGDDPNVAPFSRIDRFFNDVKFSFKAGCETGLDCRDPEPACPPEPGVDFPVDYLARDFVSFRNALLDFAAQRYPEWTLPIEADVGVMLAEVMAALGDEFSYLQDRYAREAFLETANQRRSLRKKARLLDFEIHDGRSAATLLELVVQADGAISTGLNEQTGDGLPPRVWAGSEDGEPIAFEIGSGIRDQSEYQVRVAWNAKDATPAGALTPYAFDSSELCLRAGATELYLEGTLADAGEITATSPGRVLLLRTEPKDSSVPARRHFVHVVKAEPAVDPLAEVAGKPLTRITWDESEALPFELDLALLQLSFNVLPATAGKSIRQTFVCGSSSDTDQPAAAERPGPLFSSRQDRPTIFLFGLPETDAGGLGFLGASLRNTLPEVLVHELSAGDEDGDAWTFARSMLAAQPNDEWFTLEDGTWRRVKGFHRGGVEIVHQDYATGAGFSLRFGDGEFGRVPPRGTAFRTTYRLGPGTRANVPAGSINLLSIPDDDGNMPGLVLEVTNPIEVATGVDPETQQEIKLLTPEAFRADVLFAVRPEDFSKQAEKLDFIQRAHGTPRWTGSYTTMFVAGDPFGSFTLATDQFEQLEAWMDCVRQAGRDVVVKDPKVLALDLEITVCVEPFAYAAQVQERILSLLVGSGSGSGGTPFFHPDNFTFGMPLRRSALEAAIHAVPGVRFVRDMRVHERGVSSPRAFDELVLPVDPDQVIRLDNDPARPNNGTLRVFTEGGA